jgi:hypothetical protein
MPDYRASIYDKMRFGEPERALERAGQTGQGLQRLASDLFAARARDKEREEKKKKELEQKETQEREGGNTQKLLAMYNDPNSPEFEGMEPYRKSLKMERLLYKINPEMSKRFGEQAMKEREMENKTTLTREQMGYKQTLDEEKALNLKINQLAVQYRNARLAMTSETWKNLPQSEKDQVLRELASNRAELAKMGPTARALIAATDEEIKVPSGVSVGGSNTEKLNNDNLGGGLPEFKAPEFDDKPKFDYDKAKGVLNSLAVDADKNGRIDNISNFDDALDNLVTTSGLGENDDAIKRLKKYAANLIKDIDENYRAEVDKNNRIKDDQRYADKMKRDETWRTEDKNFELEKEATKFQPIYGSYRRLRDNPTDISAKSDALTRLLRDESGAAIAETEYLGRLRSVLPDDKFKELSKKLSGVGRWIAGATGLENERMESIMFEYLGFMDSNKMLAVMKDRTGMGRVYDYLEKNYKGYNAESPKPEKGRKVVKNVDSFFGGK